MTTDAIALAPRRMTQRCYPWVVPGVVFLTEAMAFGARDAFAVFLIAVIEEFHWSRALASGVLMLGPVVWTVAARTAMSENPHKGSLTGGV